MSELIAMYSVDGYAAGKIVEVRLDGNTNVNGRNAAGKTALIKMVPSFYGVAPGTLQRESTNSRSFANYYLPNTTSYLAFVYQRAGKFVTVVITRKAGTTSLVYRFVLGRAEDTWFLQQLAGTASFVPSSNWRSHMTQAGFEVAGSVGYDDYRLIIQSNQHYRSSDRKKDQLINQYRNLYSYPTHGRDISNIHLLASAVLQRKPSMVAIKSILESVLINQGVIEQGELKVNLAANKVEEWIDNRRAYLLVEAQRGHIIQLADTQASFDHVRTRLGEIKSLSVLCKQELEQQQSALTAHLQQCSRDLDEYQQQANKCLSAAKFDIAGITERKDTHQARALELTAAKNRFERQDVPNQRARANRVNELQIQHQLAVKNLNELESGIKTLTDYYQQLLGRIETEAQGKRAQLNEQKSGYQMAHAEQLLMAQQTYTQQSSALESELTLALSAVQREVARLAEEIGRLSGQLENVGPAPEISAQRREADQELRQNQADVDNTRADLEAAQAALVQAKQVCDEGIIEQRRLDKAVEQHAHALELARARLMPKDGTLLSFLQANRPHWSQDIAKVIDPELLLRRDLHPKLIEPANSPEPTNSQATLYGIKLDVSGIEVPDFANDELLQREVHRLDEALAQLQVKQEQQQQRAVQWQKEHAEAHRVVDREQFHLRQSQDQVNKTKALLEELNIQAENDILKRRAALQSQQAELKILQGVQKQREQTLKDEHKQLKSMLKQQHDECLAAAKDALNQQLAQTKAAIVALNEDLAQRKQAIRNEEATSLREQGIDELALNRARDAAQHANADSTEAQASVHFIAQFDEFMAEQWPEHERLTAQIAECQAEINALIRQRDQALQEIRTETRALEATKEQTEDDLRKVNEDLNVITNHLTKMVNVDAPAHPLTLSSIDTAMGLVQRWQALSTEAKQLGDVGHPQFIKIRSAFVGNSGSQAYEYYQRLDTEMRETHPRWETGDRWALAAPQLLAYLNDGHNSNADMLRNVAKMLGQNLSDFSAQLERVHKQVKALGNQVTDQTEHICGNFAALDRLSVKVFSKVDKLDYYGSLKAFSQVHNDWVASDLDSLPSDEYLMRLDGIKRLLDSSGLTTKVQDSFGIEVRVVDQGVEKVAQRDQDLDGISSNGVSYLIIILIYNALVNLLRGGTEDVLVWPIDELKDFDLHNTKAMIGQLNQDNIRIFSAFPDADPAVLRYFQHLYEAKGRKDSNKRTLVRYAEFDIKSASDDLQAVLAETQAHRQTLVQSHESPHKPTPKQTSAGGNHAS